MINKDKISVLGTEIEVETEKDPLQVSSISQHIQHKAEEINRKKDTIDTVTLLYYLVIALAEEVYDLKENKANIENECNKKIDELIFQVDTAFKS
ncbi:MAG: hypothetical protein BWY26_00572 [Elusimicrobia bacterium ADurb.Bin231]|nr:MAG: hypothetical protein BWY26_00572 [Elusimicrobia bacterium ADurb.Bin231]